MNRYLFVLGLALLSIYPNSAAWGQGAYGERQFYNQLNSVRNQVRPHFKQARQHMGQLRQQGVNTSGWERQLNWVESQLKGMRWTGGTSGRGGTGFQTINPFGDYLFHGVPIRPQDGKLVTRQWDPNGLAARAEEWAKELRGLSKDINTRQGAERKQFVGELNERLTQLAAITNQQLQLADLSGGQQLKPQTGEDVSLAGLPRLQGDTPALLRDPFGRDDPTMAPGSPILEQSGPGQASNDRSEVASSQPIPTSQWSPSDEEMLTEIDKIFRPLPGATEVTFGDLVLASAVSPATDEFISRVWRDAMFLSTSASVVTTGVGIVRGLAAARTAIRSAAGSEATFVYGQLTPTQHGQLQLLGEALGVRFGLAGGYAQSTLELIRRETPDLLKYLRSIAPWRAHAGPSALKDIDLVHGVTDLGTKRQLELGVQKILGPNPFGQFKTIDLGYVKLVGVKDGYRSWSEIPAKWFGPGGPTTGLQSPWGAQGLWPPLPTIVRRNLEETAPSWGASVATWAGWVRSTSAKQEGQRASAD